MLQTRTHIPTAAALFGVSRRTIQQFCVRGDLAAIKVGAVWTTTHADIEAYLARQHATQEACRRAVRQFRDRFRAPSSALIRGPGSTEEQYQRALWGGHKRPPKQPPASRPGRQTSVPCDEHP